MFALFVILMLVTAVLTFIRWKVVPQQEEGARFGLNIARSITGALAMLFIFLSLFTIIPVGQVGVEIVLGTAKDHALLSGLRFKNPLASVEKMSTRLEQYTMSATPDEGEKKGDDAVYAISKDGLQMPLEVTFFYAIVPQDAPAVYKCLGRDYAEKILRPSSRTSVRRSVSRFPAVEAFSVARDSVSTLMTRLMVSNVDSLLKQTPGFKGKGFILPDVMLRNIDLPPAVKTAIEAKLQAEQENQKMDFTIAKERKEALRKEIEAGGIAKFQQIVSEGISEPLLKWKGIEATMELAKSDNAKIVVIGSGKDGLPLILNGDTASK